MEHVNILNMVRTTKEQEELKEIITSLQIHFYKKSFEIDTISKNQYQKFLTNAILNELKSKRIETDKAKTEDYLKSLLEELNSLNTTKIVIAVKPSPKLLEKLNEWIIKTNKQKIIFDIEVNPKILGGAIISNEEGHYIDNSLIKNIDDTLLNRKKELNSLL